MSACGSVYWFPPPFTASPAWGFTDKTEAPVNARIEIHPLVSAKSSAATRTEHIPVTPAPLMTKTTRGENSSLLPGLMSLISHQKASSVLHESPLGDNKVRVEIKELDKVPAQPLLPPIRLFFLPLCQTVTPPTPGNRLNQKTVYRWKHPWIINPVFTFHTCSHSGLSWRPSGSFQ